jgi:hypothetical protein
VELIDGTNEGCRCRTFDYSAKNLITITAEEKMIKDETKRVRSLKTGGQWLEKCANLPERPFEDDCIITMHDIAETTTAKFEKHGITTVLDMKLMTVSDRTVILGDT